MKKKLTSRKRVDHDTPMPTMQEIFGNTSPHPSQFHQWRLSEPPHTVAQPTRTEKYLLRTIENRKLASTQKDLTPLVTTLQNSKIQDKHKDPLLSVLAIIAHAPNMTTQRSPLL